ncbi:nucleoside 2-deoxyribosyltransferase [Demequina sp. NBRC 110057]|uniref:nucleoside 2-deoxyribosyltransferase n=1 Tax=Demequina sp. NBRC 110057 TaxID=1570346 RepID=UPI0013565715|nr:nucleoside 2-deoxyribosyltransferase [Demequina sp. NBRC 110057]
MTISLYLAGPEVFHPDGPALAEAMREKCAAYGLRPISPLDAGDEPLDGKPVGNRTMAEVIFANNLAMIERADAVVANLTHFRGPDPDPGTAFEVGYGFAQGKRCYVYSHDGATAVERVERFYGPVSHRSDGTPVDHDGLTIENFGAPFNLMLSSASVVISGDFDAALRRVASDLKAGIFANMNA